MKSERFNSISKPLIYLITDGKAIAENFADKKAEILKLIKNAVQAKISLIQIREKKLSARLVFELAAEAVKLRRNTETKILINDRADIALAANADGVHLTSHSLTAEIIRQTFPQNFIIGVSTHTIEEAELAKNQGADFATFSPIFDSPGKGNLQGVEKLREVCEKLKPFPMVALGGIDKTNYKSVLDNGASGFAAIRFLNNVENLKKMGSKQKNKSQIANRKSNIAKICLTIAGLDPSGGAGIIADIKTFSAFGCFATAAITSITFQNTTGVFGAIHQTAESVRGQVEPIVADFEISALKTGMLPTHEVIVEVARLVQANNLKNFVVDPVVRSTSGFDLIDDEALKVLIEKLFPLADIVTPNLPEAERIANMKIENETDIKRAAKIMQSYGAKNVLIKGGHFEVKSKKAKVKSKGQRTKDKGRTAEDFLFIGSEKYIFEAKWIETTATHGTGCTLAAAITANLALGKSLIEAVEIAKKFVTQAIKTAPNIGKGNSPIQISK